MAVTAFVVVPVIAACGLAATHILIWLLHLLLVLYCHGRTARIKSLISCDWLALLEVGLHLRRP